MRALIVLALSMSAGIAQAQIHKCTDSSGRKVYQDRPCEDQAQSQPFDAGYVTTIDSETSRRETQGALIMREQTREQRVEIVTPAGADTRVEMSGPGPVLEPYDDRNVGYPVYLGRDHGHDDHDHDHLHRHGDRDRDDRRDRRRPDETPMQDSSRRAGGNYAPAPPTIQQVAPRSPSSRTAATAGRERAPQPPRGGRREDEPQR